MPTLTKRESSQSREFTAKKLEQRKPFWDVWDHKHGKESGRLAVQGVSLTTQETDYFQADSPHWSIESLMG